MSWKTSLLSVSVGIFLGASGIANAETLKIGIIGAMTGPSAENGTAAKEAAKIFADETNAKGGLDIGGTKYQIKVIPYDDQAKPAEAIAAYNRLINVDGAKYVLMQSSASTLAVKDNAESDQVVVLTAAFSPKVIDENSKFIFRIYQTGGDYTPSLVNWMKDNIKQRSVITFDPNDETGWSQSKVTSKTYSDAGFKVLASELYERSQQDFSPLLTKAIALNPEIIDFGSTQPATAGLIVRQARELGYKGMFAQTGGPGWRAVVAAAGDPSSVDGMVTITYADPQNKAYQALSEKGKQAIGQTPNEIIVNYYDALTVLAKAMQIAGGPEDSEKVAASIKSALPMPSLQGDTLTYGPQQIRSVDYASIIKNGVPEVVGKLK